MTRSRIPRVANKTARAAAGATVTNSELSGEKEKKFPIHASPDPLAKSDRYRLVIPYSGNPRELGRQPAEGEAVTSNEGAS